MNKFKKGIIAVGGVVAAGGTGIGIFADSMGIFESVFGKSEESAVQVEVKRAPVEQQRIDQLYQQLSIAALAEPHDGQTVSFAATYLGLNGYASDSYQMYGIADSTSLSIAHRPPGYETSPGPLGGSDAEFPPFAMLLPLDRADEVAALSKYQPVIVSGIVEVNSKKPRTGLMKDQPLPTWAAVTVRVVSIEPNV